jgi:hypothetical protein
MEPFMTEMQKFVKRENIRFLEEFLKESVKCGELTEIGKERLKENKDLKDFFDEGRDEMVETLQDTFKELSSLKARIKGDGLEYLLQEEDEEDEEDEEIGDSFQELLQKCPDDFIQISEFRGLKKGYTFKTDSQGTGYYKNGVTFEESSEEEDLVECEGCSRVWDGNAQCPCGMDYEIFEGQSTFPTECTDETNKFILRYIAKEWPDLTYYRQEYTNKEVAYKIYKKNDHPYSARFHLPPSSPASNGDVYTLSGNGSCGVVCGFDSRGESFILDVKGKAFEELDNVLCILQDGVEEHDAFEGRYTFPTECTDETINLS